MPESNEMAQQSVREKVRDGYARIAAAEQADGAASCCGPTSCCGGDAADAADQLARAVGYADDDLAVLPEGANLGLSCGNPVALASLRPGETVIDLGSGAGFDVFIAGRRVGEWGRAIGVDMTPEMLAKARRNAALYTEKTGLRNVEFRLGEIEHLPIADGTAGIVISNCVINLSPEKPQVWREIVRVLRPGGRVAVSDLALRRPLPAEVAAMVEALVGCVAGAVLVEETERMAREAGLEEIALECRDDYVDGMESWQDPLFAKIKAALPEGTKLSDFVTSLSLRARKPGTAAGGCC